MSDSRDFQDVESVCRSKLSYVPIQPGNVLSLVGILSRDQSQRLDTRNLLGTSGDVFWKFSCTLASSSGESELAAVVSAAAEGMGLQSFNDFCV